MRALIAGTCGVLSLRAHETLTGGGVCEIASYWGLPVGGLAGRVRWLVVVIHASVAPMICF